jgi:D-glycero-alpha-D-manno-heptose-7-phosphate kinase
MIISRTPLRMSFCGGGSDMAAFYRHERGAVICTAIDKYVYVTVNKKFDQGLRVAYSRNEETEHVDDIEHPLVRATLKLLKITGGIEITTIADISSKGSGLGSSSAFTVGLLNAMRAYSGIYSSAETLASGACNVEIDLCGEPIGKQDQYAAAYGGFNFIEFLENDQVIVSPVICKPETRKALEEF